VNRKSPGRQRADAEFARLCNAPALPLKPIMPAAENRPEKTLRLKALRIETEGGAFRRL